MSNATIPFPKPADAAAAFPAKSAARGEKEQYHFWQAFTFSDGFEQAVYQAGNPDVPATAAPVCFDSPPPAGYDASMDKVTSSQWLVLQCELVDAVDNVGNPPFSFSLQLPQLGDIDVTLATLAPQGWDIALRFSRDSYQLLKHRREACRRSLSDALGCPVRLSFASREDERW
ncbi:type III secretion protein [Brenneria izadpanahii]|uniref:Type III secretion protein n=1 Tax=Brenneria izadpanahii TaxID=2722756 RepID=A0ABX7UTE8_9GAMM|nr:type III secretion system HrpP C-terminal domain-containing protein [Brenneria izadpanahii]QTF08176.1 type III secretion protein [Brenneria izadpanahii]